ncbi:hypothetical protein HRI_004989300 [Hibiscus trionum]|uniref:Uncharacterized protein n=1 Tax=Hibiscus trionum TaxID=183268 RepID=A0A9W7JEQ7_HIBTR|nr:hypothetical protein HRI_004989300 [Hibiscus trionum]
MQVMSSSASLSPTFNNFSGTGFPDVAGKFSHDFGLKLQLKDEEPNKEEEEKLNSQPEIEDEDEKEEQSEEEEEGEEEEEFSFVCLSPDVFPVSADDLFQDGQIRPIFPLFNQDLLFADEDGTVWKTEEGDVALPPQVRKVFVEESTDSTSSEPAGPYCEWRGAKTVEEASPDTCRKSNSTGFSKLWRFRDLKLRCNSDGRNAFVLLSHPPPSSSSSSVKTEKKNEKEEKKPTTLKAILEKPKEKKSGKMASPSAHEKLYVKNRAQKEGIKRRSYLPYKQVGFFTNVSSLSRNVHPY